MRPLVATYRLQLGPDLTFDDAAGLVDHLAALGVSHLYLSPVLQAAPGSTHGYDVVDHDRVSAELGGDEGFDRLTRAAAEAGLGVVVDLVPNHMATAVPQNRWFTDVLEHGPSSRFARHLDIDWDPPEASLRNRVLLPVLGDQYGRVLDAGEIRLVRHGGAFRVVYFDHQLPVAPRSLAPLLEAAGRAADDDELRFLAHVLDRLPLPSATDLASRHERWRDVAVAGSLLDRRLDESPDAAAAVDAEVARTNGDPDALDDLLQRQSWRLAHWRAAAQDLDYRRFFDIDSLIGVRVEDPQVFADSHALVLGWVADGRVDGLRIDHPDGLADPADYLVRLRGEAPGAWIVVEKILEADEALPPWPVDGTTGYEALQDVTRLFVDPGAADGLVGLQRWLVEDPEATWAATATAAKHQVLRDVLAADLNRLTSAFAEVGEHRRSYRDLTRVDLAEALTAALVAMDVYRTYVDDEHGASLADHEVIDRAVAEARADHVNDDALDLLADVLAGRADGPAERDLRRRFQQLSGPVMAKAVEDTSFYRWLPDGVLCEVGGDPSRVGWSDLGDFHQRRWDAQQRWPRTMTTLATHDTKRGEDTRAALAVLTEDVSRWQSTLERWLGGGGTGAGDRATAPDRTMANLLLQTMVAAHPLTEERALAYLGKASREAKVHTSWTDPDADYDAALEAFVRATFADEALRDEVAAYAASIADAVRTTSLAQKLVQLTIPGVPDVYQGTELWDRSLVDPDNRRPADHDRRRRLLAELTEGDRSDGALFPADIAARTDEGLAKLWVLHRALAVRGTHAEAFGPGEAGRYEPVPAEGPAAGHVVAFARGGRIVTVVPRLVVGLERAGGWGGDTVELPAGRWHDAINDRTVDGGAVEVADLLAPLPVALLTREAE